MVISNNLNNLLELNISNNNFDQDNINILITALSGNTFLKKLSLVNCNIMDSSVISISTWLSNNNSLVDLDLSYNK